MKDTLVVTTIENYDTENYNPITEEVVGKVVSEPYPKISSGFGAPERNGGTYSTTNSTTCVVVQREDTGQFLHDIPLHNLKLYTPPMTVASWMIKNNLSSLDIVGLGENLGALYTKVQDEVDAWNKEVDVLETSIRNCTSNILPVPKDLVKDYFENLPHFKMVGVGWGKPSVVFDFDKEAPVFSLWDSNNRPLQYSDWGYYLHIPEKRIVNLYLKQDYQIFQEKVSKLDIYDFYGLQLSVDEVELLDNLITITENI